MKLKKLLTLTLYFLVLLTLLYSGRSSAQPAEGGGGQEETGNGCENSKVTLILSYRWASDSLRRRIEERSPRFPSLGLIAIAKKVVAVELTGAPLKPGESAGPVLTDHVPPIGVSAIDFEPTGANLKRRIGEAAAHGKTLTSEQARRELRREYLKTVIDNQNVRNCSRNGEKAVLLLTEEDYRDWLGDLGTAPAKIEELIKSANGETNGLRAEKVLSYGGRKVFLLYDPNCFTDPCGPADRGILAIFRKIASVEGYGSWAAAILELLSKAAPQVSPNVSTDSQYAAAFGLASVVTASRNLDLVSLSYWVRFGMVTATKLKASVYRNPHLPADTNGDGIVTTSDLVPVLNHNGKPLPNPERNALGYFPDVDGNRRVDNFDVLLVVQAIRAQQK